MKIKRLASICAFIGLVGLCAWYVVGKATTNEIELSVGNNISLTYVKTYNEFGICHTNDKVSWTNDIEPLHLEYKVSGNNGTTFKVSDIVCSNTTDNLYKALTIMASYDGDKKLFTPLDSPNYNQAFTTKLSSTPTYIDFFVYLDGESPYCVESNKTLNSCKMTIELSTID